MHYETVDGAVCGNGTPVGMGIMRGDPTSTTLVVIINGGGACWDGLSCFVLNGASYLHTTYTEATFAQKAAGLESSPLLHRDDESNPLRDAHLAYVPYCTGDIHSGIAVREYPYDIFGNKYTVHHAGRVNATLFAARLAEQMPHAQHVFLIGMSAGGFGAVFTHDVFAAAFPGAVVDVLSDSAPLVPTKDPALFATWMTTWNSTLPSGCANCGTVPSAIIDARRAQNPQDRFALIAVGNDHVIRAFFGLRR